MTAFWNWLKQLLSRAPSVIAPKHNPGNYYGAPWMKFFLITFGKTNLSMTNSGLRFGNIAERAIKQ